MIRRHLLRALLAAARWARANGSAVLVVLALAVLVAGVCAFRVEARLAGDRVSWHEALYYTLGLFTLQGNRFGYPRSSLLRVLCFAAPAVSASALVGAFVRLVEESGPLVLRRFRGHTVIGGLGHLGAAIAEAEERRHGPFIAIERDGLSPQATTVRASGSGAVLVGDMTSEEILRRARCHNARQVFLTAPSDITNLEAAFRVRRLSLARPSAQPPTVFAHVYDGGLSSALEDELRADRAGEAAIVPFNSYRFATKSLMAMLLRERLVGAIQLAPGVALARTAWAGEGEPLRDVPPEEQAAALDEDRRRLVRAFHLVPDDAPLPEARFAVVGLGRFGRSLLHELITHSLPRASTFLVVERSDESFAATAAGLTAAERARLELHRGDAAHPEAAARIAAFAPSAALVCTDNDLGNLRLSLELHRRGIRAVSRMFDLDAGSALASGFEERGLTTVGLARLFRAAIPILTHERRLRACIDLDLRPTPHLDHLFYLARVTPAERRRLGRACVGVEELPRDAELPSLPDDLALVWYQAVGDLDPYFTPAQPPAP